MGGPGRQIAVQSRIFHSQGVFGLPGREVRWPSILPDKLPKNQLGSYRCCGPSGIWLVGKDTLHKGSRWRKCLMSLGQSLMSLG